MRPTRPRRDAVQQHKVLETCELGSKRHWMDYFQARGTVLETSEPGCTCQSSIITGKSSTEFSSCADWPAPARYLYVSSLNQNNQQQCIQSPAMEDDWPSGTNVRAGRGTTAQPMVRHHAGCPGLSRALLLPCALPHTRPAPSRRLGPLPTCRSTTVRRRCERIHSLHRYPVPRISSHPHSPQLTHPFSPTGRRKR